MNMASRDQALEKQSDDRRDQKQREASPIVAPCRVDVRYSARTALPVRQNQ